MKRPHHYRPGRMTDAEVREHTRLARFAYEWAIAGFPSFYTSEEIQERRAIADAWEDVANMRAAKKAQLEGVIDVYVA